MHLFFLAQNEEDIISFSEGTLYGSDKLSWRTERYKYIYDLHPEAKQKAELYDWQNDPGEKENLVEKQPESARELHHQLGRFTNKLLARAKTMSQPEVKNMNPRAIESLKSLGYIR